MSQIAAKAKPMAEVISIERGRARIKLQKSEPRLSPRTVTEGETIERQATALWKTPRVCEKCGRPHRTKKVGPLPRLSVRPVYDRKEMVWGCEDCYPPAKEPREDKKLIASLMVPMFGGSAN